VNAAAFLIKAAAQRPGYVALRHGERTITYGELSERVRRMAAGLRKLGLEDGDRVLILQRNSPELVETLQGGMAAGLTVVPVNVRLHPGEVAYIARDAGARVIVHGEEFNDRLAEISHELETVEQRVSLAPKSRRNRL